MKPAERNHIDILTLVSVLILMVMSLAVVYSASSAWAVTKYQGNSAGFITRHAVKVMLSFICMFAAMKVDYTVYKKHTKTALIICATLLLATLAFGGETKGAARWIRFGGFGLQPSEIAKFALIFHLAVMMSEKKERIRDFATGFLPMMFWVGLVTVLVLLQPNRSTGSMIFAISMTMLFIGGVRWKHLLLSAAAIIPAIIGYLLVAPYSRLRVMGFINGSTSSSKTMSQQLWQGIVGFGSGGIFGVGPGASRQREWFIPESYGDFIFSIVGEEYGLIGTIALMGLFLLILLRGIRIARNARDDYGRFLASGITAAVTLYALVNAGVTLGLLPTTGLPMPFVSYGGTSMLFSAVAIGVLLNISSQTDMHPRAGGLRERIQSLSPKRTPAVGKVY